MLSDERTFVSVLFLKKSSTQDLVAWNKRVGLQLGQTYYENPYHQIQWHLKDGTCIGKESDLQINGVDGEICVPQCDHLCCFTGSD